MPGGCAPVSEPRSTTLGLLCAAAVRAAAVRAAAVCAAALLLSACSTGGKVQALNELPDDVSIGVHQNRTDFAKRQLEVSVSNDSDRELTITGLVFDSTQFAAPATWAKDATTIAPGVTADLPGRLPEADCDVEHPEAVVRIEFALSGDEPASAVVTPVDTFDRLPQLLAEDCLHQSVAETVVLTAAEALDVTTINGITVAKVDITVSPTGRAGPVTIDATARTTLLAHADPTSGGQSTTASPERVNLFS